MIPEGNILNNVTRFSGFESKYHKHRPEAPRIVVELLSMYLQKKPSMVVDLGCGTGLSSFIWQGHADRIVGVEPNDDMRSKAEEQLAQAEGDSSISFVNGYSNQLDFDSETVDIITCSQSFHWMDPDSTLKECSRVLRKGGIFAAYDCDWPPSVDWKIEEKYIHLMDKVDRVIEQRGTKETSVRKWPKDEHLKNIKNSAAFRFTKEIVFHNGQACDAQRYVGLALSQGGLQTVLKSGWSDLNDDISSFAQAVQAFFGNQTLNVMFSYRMRMGIK